MCEKKILISQDKYKDLISRQWLRCVANDKVNNILRKRYRRTIGACRNVLRRITMFESVVV